MYMGRRSEQNKTIWKGGKKVIKGKEGWKEKKMRSRRKGERKESVHVQ